MSILVNFKIKDTKDEKIPFMPKTCVINLHAKQYTACIAGAKLLPFR